MLMLIRYYFSTDTCFSRYCDST